MSHSLNPEITRIVANAFAPFSETSEAFRSASQEDEFAFAFQMLRQLSFHRSPVDRLNIHFILWDLYKDHPLKLNPFLGHFIEVYRNHEDLPQSSFVARILAGQGSHLAVTTPDTWLRGVTTQEDLAVDVNSLEEQLDILFNDSSDKATLDSQSLAGQSVAGYGAISGQGCGGSESLPSQEIIGGALQKAASEDISKADSDALLSWLRADPTPLEKTVDLSIATMESLLSCNPTLTRDLIRLMLGTQRRADVLDTLPYLPVSLTVLETLSLLFQSAALSVEETSAVLHAFLANATRSVEAFSQSVNSTPAHRTSQKHRVRLLCLFINAVIRNGVATLDEYFYDIQSLTINFLWVAEANELHKLIKLETSYI